jgi:hypothetical protein
MAGRRLAKVLQSDAEVVHDPVREPMEKADFPVIDFGRTRDFLEAISARRVEIQIDIIEPRASGRHGPIAEFSCCAWKCHAE